MGIIIIEGQSFNQAASKINQSELPKLRSEIKNLEPDEYELHEWVLDHNHITQISGPLDNDLFITIDDDVLDGDEIKRFRSIEEVKNDSFFHGSTVEEVLQEFGYNIYESVFKNINEMKETISDNGSHLLLKDEVLEGAVSFELPIDEDFQIERLFFLLIKPVVCNIDFEDDYVIYLIGYKKQDGDIIFAEDLGGEDLSVEYQEYSLDLVGL